MSRRATFGALMLAAGAAMTCISWSAPRAATWKILDMKARTFDQASGAFTDVTSSSGNSPVKWMLVTVTAKGCEDADASTMPVILLSGAERSKTIFSRVTKPGPFRTDSTGKFTVPFWIEGERCEPLKLRAGVVGHA